MSKSGPRMLVLDIETSPMRSYTWGCFKQYVQPKQIIEPSRVLSIAWQWVGEKQIGFMSEWHNDRDMMIEAIWHLLEEADVVIGFNSQAFDCKFINSEFLAAGLTPPTDYKHIDLLKTVRQNFREPTNKLEWIATKLDIGNKLEHYGFGLWRDCLAGDAKAWALMKRYNKADVKLTMEAYEILKPWVKTQFNYGLYGKSHFPTCKNCGSDDVQLLDKTAKTKTRQYLQYRCTDCGTVQRGRKMAEVTGEGVLV